MTNWPQVTLGDHIDLLTGFPFKSARFTSGGRGVRLLKGSVVSQGELDWHEAAEWPANDDGDYQKFELETGDVILAMDRPWLEAGLKYAWITPGDTPSLLVQRVARLRGRNDLDTTFLRYVIGSPAFTNYIAPIVTGVTVPHISPRQICSFTFGLPPVNTQLKVAAILSAYDDLVENNNRQIKLLEEMAQRIYREWFVDFRYPGHENVPLVHSELGPIPEGWEVARMDKIADVIDCLHSKKPVATADGTGILLQLFNIGSGGVIDLSEVYKISSADYEQWTSRMELQAGDCVITNVGRIAAVGQIPPELKAAAGRNMTAVRPRSIPPTYLLQYLLSDHMEHEVHRKKDAGSIMDSLNVKGIVKLAVPVPGDSLAMKFEMLCRPIRRKIELLVTRHYNLRATRNLLLPRLVTGEIDVTSLDIAIPEAAA